MNVVYVFKQAFSERNHERYGIDFMRGRGHRVTVLDVGPFYRPPVPGDRGGYGARDGLDLRLIATGADLERASEAFAEAAVVFYMVSSQRLSRRDVPILRLISRSGRPYVVAMINAVPGMTAEDRATPRLAWIGETLRRAREIDPVNSLVARMPLGLLGIRPAAAILYAGRRSRGRSQMAAPSTRPIGVHAMDYDVFRDVRGRVGPTRDVAVFVDQNRPFSQDAVEYRAGNRIDADAYFAGLRRLFERVEAELGLRVVVAIHPRARYADRPELFGGREIVAGETARLIGESRLVILHQSTAVNFAVLFGKPVLIAASKALIGLQVWHKYWYGLMAERLGTRVRFLDEPNGLDLADALSLDPAAYAAYVEDYIKEPGTPDLPFWQVVTDELAKAGVARL
jgi:hypothetical protein